MPILCSALIKPQKVFSHCCGLSGPRVGVTQSFLTPPSSPPPEKAFASSSFYRPDHPTIDDQVELAQRISFSLVDENNKMSRGQSMYMKRKKRSMRWIHAGESPCAVSASYTIPTTTPTPPRPVFPSPPSPVPALCPVIGIFDFNA